MVPSTDLIPNLPTEPRMSVMAKKKSQIMNHIRFACPMSILVSVHTPPPIVAFSEVDAFLKMSDPVFCGASPGWGLSCCFLRRSG